MSHEPHPWTINYIDTKAKCSHLPSFTCAACVYQSLQTGEIVSHVGIFDTAMWTFVHLTFSLVHSPPPPPCDKFYTYTYTVCKGGGYGVLGLRQINTCREVPLLVKLFRGRWSKKKKLLACPVSRLPQSRAPSLFNIYTLQYCSQPSENIGSML